MCSPPLLNDWFLLKSRLRLFVSWQCFWSNFSWVQKYGPQTKPHFFENRIPLEQKSFPLSNVCLLGSKQWIGGSQDPSHTLKMTIPCLLQIVPFVLTLTVLQSSAFSWLNKCWNVKAVSSSSCLEVLLESYGSQLRWISGTFSSIRHECKFLECHWSRLPDMTNFGAGCWR